MSGILLEVCCGSADDVIQAHRGGADRVELNCDLFHGGLTPTLGSLRVAKGETGMPIIAMVRPREGGFCYTKAEFAAAVEDARLLLEHGADGLAFGFLHEDGRVDVERTRVLAELCRERGRESVFHRAMDVTPDWRAALDQLIELGVTRVLTSGQEASVPLGADTIRAMADHAAGRIQILPGGGINARNLEWVARHTGCAQLHMSGHRVCTDPSARNDRGIHYGGCLYPPEDCYKVVDGEYVAGVAARLKKLYQ